jgi:hypothetical protein
VGGGAWFIHIPFNHGYRLGYTRTSEYYLRLIAELIALRAETEWVEFKHSKKNPEEIGEYILAIARDTIDAELIRPYDASVGSHAKKYVPFWA